MPFGSRPRNRRSASEAPSDDIEKAREAALRMLDHSRRTRSDLTRRLRDRGFSAPIVEELLERLAAVSLVDDVEFARAWLAGRLGRRPSGWRRLEQELRARGISSDDIATARTKVEQEQGGATDEVAGARKVIAQADRRYKGLDERTRKQRLYALLIRRGFDGETIERALKEEKS